MGTNSSAKHCDMVVIGSGAAGHHGAIQAAKPGKKIAVVERSITLGGRGQYQHRYDSEQGTSGGCHAFYPIRIHGSPDLGLKPGAEN
jgi:heterodisulfide reductase subunit A-like polyferredoxin